jgi:predicted Zn-dependent protease with MMP-like domain
MTPADRERFDRELERVLADMPPLVHQLLEKVQLVVEDYPSRKLMQDFGLKYRDDLCGLYQGEPLIDPKDEPEEELSTVDGPVTSDSILIFREGIVAMSRNEREAVSIRELRKQIRITILHELGHHFGMTEDELDALGYG